MKQNTIIIYHKSGLMLKCNFFSSFFLYSLKHGKGLPVEVHKKAEAIGVNLWPLKSRKMSLSYYFFETENWFKTKHSKQIIHDKF